MSEGRVNSLCITHPLQRLQPLRTQGKRLETAKSVPWKWRTVVLGAEKAQRKHPKYSCVECASASQCAETTSEGLESPTP